MEVLPQTRKGNLISQAGLLRAIVILLVLGALLIGSVWMTAKAADIKYSVNRINKESMLLEDEIDLLRIKIESANGIEAVEAYAINEMGMKYPRADQCIYIEKDAVVREDLVSLIKQKAYE
jgi:cell division protein FtsL